MEGRGGLWKGTLVADRGRDFVRPWGNWDDKGGGSANRVIKNQQKGGERY